MAINRLEDISEDALFGRRLFILGANMSICGPAAVARELYKNDKCYECIQPKGRNVKLEDNKEDDIETIARTVQRHFRLESAIGVSGNYILAYSVLFDCSLDYLYGRTDVKSCDLEVREICDKLHITENAVKNLIEGYDPDPKVNSSTRFWSEVLSDEIFHTVPEKWFFYCIEMLQFADLSKKIEAIKKAEQSAEEPIYRAMMETRRIAFEKMLSSKSSDCEGAFRNLSIILTKFIDSRMEIWVESRHVEYEDSYYDYEMKKIKRIEEALKEGAPLEKKKK